MLHFHKYKIKRAEKSYYKEYIPGDWRESTAIKRTCTNIYEVCTKCGKAKIRSIIGHWELEELIIK